MTKSVRTVGPETPLKHVARILAEERISGVPVVDSEGRVLGVVSEIDILAKERGAARTRFDLLSWLAEWEDTERKAKLKARTAGEAMTHPPVTISAGSPVSRAAAFMVDRGVSRLPVTDVDGKLVGIISCADLVRAFARPDSEIESDIRTDVLDAKSISPNAVRVAVQDGEVTLAGTVESRAVAEGLVSAVERVLGVVSVRSELAFGLRDDEARLSRLARR